MNAIAFVLLTLITSSAWPQGATSSPPAPPSPFLVVAPAPSDSLSFRMRLPDFGAVDTNGRIWTSQDLRGKWTVVEIWSVGCGPCRREHPELQRFHDKVKSTANIQVLTLNIDNEFDYDLVKSYLKSHKYEFPVIADPGLNEKLFGLEGGIPQTWVINSAGLRSKRFRSWSLGRILSEVERAANPKGN